MRWLRTSDYYRLIQPNDLNTLLSTATQGGYDATQLLLDCENGAIETVKSYISARYDVNRVFSDTPIYNNSNTYYGQNRVQYHEPAFNPLTVYTTGQRVSYQGSIYSSISGSTAHAFLASEWNFICLDYSIYSALTPNAEFQDLANYLAGITVWFKDNYTYTSLKNTQGQSLLNAVYSAQGADTSNNPNARMVEDTTNTAYWQRNSIYSFSGQLPTNGTYWAQVDNRNALLIECVIKISLYTLHQTISPRNIPINRLIDYDGNNQYQNGGAIGWLKEVAKGEISASIYQISPIQGLGFIFSYGQPKLNNMY